MLYPITFEPILKERVWGGRDLQELYGKPLPDGTPIGESWEVSDRPDDVSVIANGPLAGNNLHWLVEHHAQELFGKAGCGEKRFPLLIKLLDAEQKLSLQVHPPAEVAAELGGEPKTEMWYVAQAAPGAEIYVGLKRGVTRQEFERRLHDGTVEDCFHRIQVRPGDAMFLPSGRVHAIGAGLVIFEVQQNSDTTYRVFDWNRPGLDGKPRALHIRESLASINFDDFEPALAPGNDGGGHHLKPRVLANDALFRVQLLRAERQDVMALEGGKLRMVGVVDGRLRLADGSVALELASGQFGLIPAELASVSLWLEAATSFLLVETGSRMA